MVFHSDPHLLVLVVLAQQSIGAVGDTHGDDAHGADHHHGNVDVREDRHDRSSQGEAQSTQDVDHLNAQVVVVQVFL